MIRLLPFSSTLITALFAAAILLRFSRRGGLHSLLWGIGLILYGLGTFSEAFLGLTYSPFVLRVWYITGAMLTAAWLGHGTLYLLARKRGNHVHRFLAGNCSPAIAGNRHAAGATVISALTPVVKHGILRTII